MGSKRTATSHNATSTGGYKTIKSHIRDEQTTLFDTSEVVCGEVVAEVGLKRQKL